MTGDARPLGRTGLTVAPLAFGAWQIAGPYRLGQAPAGLPAPADSPRALVARALELGINLFDTARHYGSGESLLGDCLAGASPRPVVVSKCGIAPDGRRDLSPAAIRTAVAESARSLGRERLDAYLASIAAWDAAAQAAADTLAALRDQGRLAAWGLSLNRAADVRSILDRDGPRPDLLEVPFNLFDVSLAPLIARCRDLGVGVLVKSPLNKGVLTGKYRPGTVFPAADVRSTYLSGPVLAARDAWIEAFLAAFGLARRELRAVALRFVLATPGVAAVVVGQRSLAQLEENAALLDAPMEAATVEAIRRFSENRADRLEPLHA